MEVTWVLGRGSVCVMTGNRAPGAPIVHLGVFWQTVRCSNTLHWAFLSPKRESHSLGNQNTNSTALVLERFSSWQSPEEKY